MQVKSIVRKFLNKQIVIIGCCVLFSWINCPAQNNLSANPSFSELEAWVFPEKPLLNQSCPTFYAVTLPQFRNLQFSINQKDHIRPPSLQFREEIAFFCRIEYQLALKTNLPFKFRLGSVEYVDWLEGKPGCSSF